VFLR
jgi:hypothetical protein